VDPREVLDQLEDLADSTGRYRLAAFVFVLGCLEHARRRLDRQGHITGRELAESARLLALEQFGPIAKVVLNEWGLESTEDIGRIVFLMVDNEILSKTEEDRIEDFRDAFDFEVEFVRNYRW
jgi:uncharacterized repeat protein (TIGR04138 family)